jgi:hypothetical protein
METELQTTDTAEATTPAAPDHLAEEMSRIYDRHTSNDDSRTPNEEGALHSAEKFARANAEGADTETKPTDTPLDLPKSWGKDKAQLWDKLDPEAREFISQRETEAQRKISELGQLAKQARDTDSQIGAVYERHRASIPRLPDGREMQAHEAFDLLLITHQKLESQPAAAIQFLANHYGINLAELGRPEVDPITQIRQQERAAVQSEFQQILAQQHAQQETARLQYLTEELESFAKGKDYWPKIEDELVHQIHAMKAVNEQRVLANPLGALKEAEERALKVVGIDPKAGDKETERKRKADAAKRMASINVSSRGFGGTPRSQGQTLEQTMRDVYHRMNGSD